MEKDTDKLVRKEADEIYESAQDWINQNMKYFDLTINRASASDELQFKAFIELLFMADMFYPATLFHKKLIQKIIDLAIHVSHNVSFAKYFLNDPSLVSGGQEMIIFKENYKVKDIFDDKDRFKSMVGAGIDLLARRTPYRLLDSSYSMHKAGVKTMSESDETYYKMTVLPNKRFNYLYLSDSSAYSITHTLFYITDMGRKHPSYLDYNRITLILRSMIIFYACKGNMDILGECLLDLAFINADELLNMRQDPLVLACFELIRKAQNNSGYVYSPRHLDDSKMTDEDVFFENYHTSMVSLGAAYAFR